MPCVTNIRFSNLKRSEALEEDALKKIHHLEHLYPQMEECNVVIDLPNKQPTDGMQYEIRLHIMMRGAVVQIDRQRNTDAYIALHEAFRAAHARLEHLQVS